MISTRSAQAVLLILGLLAGSVQPVLARSASSVYRELPKEDRVLIKESLVWTGHYDGRIDGVIDSTTIRAIQKFQRASGSRPSGLLTAEEARALASQAREIRERLGYAPHTDPVTGITIGLPLGLVSPAGKIEQGSRFASKDGRVAIELFRLDPSAGSLKTLFRRVSARQGGRRPTYTRQRNDWFVVTGFDGPQRFYTRARKAGRDTVAFAIAYDESIRSTIEPVIVAMSSSFAEPGAVSELSPDRAAALAESPSPAPPIAPLPEIQAAAPAPPLSGDPAPPAKPDLPPGLRGVPPAAATFAVSGDGHFLTTARIASCRALSIGEFGAATLIAVDRRNDLALIKAEAKTDDLLAPFASDPVSVGQNVTAATPQANAETASYVSIGQIMAVSGPDGDSSRVQVAAPPRPDDGGAPLLDAFGRVVGILAPLSPDAIREAMLTPGPGGRPALRRELAQMFLSSQGLTPPAPQPSDAELERPEIADRAKRLTRPVFCEDGPREATRTERR